MSVLLRFTDSDYLFGIFKLFLESIGLRIINEKKNELNFHRHIGTHFCGSRKVLLKHISITVKHVLCDLPKEQ
jgi:hypothetical protein